MGRVFDDARLAKGDHTRRVVLDAVVALLGERRTEPTMTDVAARAQVSVRIVYYHFGGIADLLMATVAFQSDRHRPAPALDHAQGEAMPRRAGERCGDSAAR